jgi:hypothetical protein
MFIIQYLVLTADLEKCFTLLAIQNAIFKMIICIS